MKDWIVHNRWILVFSIIVAFIASSPYIYGFLTRKEGQVFLGRSVVNSADTYVYLSNIISAKHGSLILPNLYSVESKIPFEFRPTYYLLGLIARIFNHPPLAVYHLGRIIYTILFVLVLSKFIQIFTKGKFQFWLTFFIVLFSSGLGFIVKYWFPESIDLWVPESNTFFSLLEAPHFISTQIFLIISIYFFIKYLRNTKNKFLFFSSFFASVTILEYPYIIPFVFLFYSIIIFLFIKSASLSKRLIYLVLFNIMPIIAGIVIYSAYSLSPSAGFWYDQNVLFTPSLNNVLYGYGLLLGFTLISFYSKNLSDRRLILLFIWVIIIFILIYSPVNFQRRILVGLHIPLSILAAIGIIHLLSKIRQKYVKYIISVILIIILSATNIFNTLYMVSQFQNDSIQRNIYYLDADEMAGMIWLGRNSKDGEVVLANTFYSNIIPGVSGRFVYQGHNFLTYKPKEKEQLFDGIMKTKNDDLRLEFLKKFGINYIYFGKNDPYNIYRVSFEKRKYLKTVWDKNGVLIYKVSGV